MENILKGARGEEKAAEGGTKSIAKPLREGSDESKNRDFTFSGPARLCEFDRRCET